MKGVAWPIVALLAVGWFPTATMADARFDRLVALRHVGAWTSQDPQTRQRLDLSATDLGVSFPITAADGDRQLLFLFGDTHTHGQPMSGRWDEDVIAVAPPAWTDRTQLPKLRWLTRADGQFLSLIVPEQDLRAMEVPLDGVQVGSRIVLFFNDGYDFQERTHRFLVCAEARDGDFQSLNLRFKQPSRKFLNVSLSPDPRDPGTIWIFGTGHYRKSPIYLAKAPAGALHDFTAWRFRTSDGWSSSEDDAAAQIDGRYGELSVRFVPAADSWVMIYQRSRGRGIPHAAYARIAAHPMGRWSDEVTILEPDQRLGIGFTQFMHASVSAAGFCDGLSNPGRENESGAVYGAYLVPEWCHATQERLHLAFTLSSWNPYQVQLMEAVLAREDSVKQPATEKFGVSLTQPPPFSWNPQAGETGIRWIVPDAARWLTFELRGRGVIARLLDESGRRLRESRGPYAAEQSLKVRWRIDALSGRTVRLQVTSQGTDASAAITPPQLESSP